jgi:hypothetical protein
MRKKLTWGLSTIIVIIIALILTERKNGKYAKEILEFPKYTNGIFEKFRYEKGKAIISDYSFEVNGVVFKSWKSDGRLREIGNYLFNRTFPVIYNMKDPTKNEILVFPSDFLNYKLTYPDSLNWVRKIIE